MDPIPKDSSWYGVVNEKGDNESIPLDVRNKEKRTILEKNGGKMPPKPDDKPQPAETANDGRSEKQMAEDGVQSDESKKVVEENAQREEEKKAEEAAKKEAKEKE